MCTCFRLKSKDEAVIVGRTMEFGIDLQGKLTVFPRGHKFAGTGASGKPGLTWEAKYGFVGMNALNLPYLLDGMNEEGLYIGCLYLPGFTKYQEVPSGSESKSISPLDAANFFLSTCASVEDVKKTVQEIFIWNQPSPVPEADLSIHFSIHDSSGAAIVIEYVGGELKIHDNPVAVLTNAPTFDWHLLNLGNYVNLSATNVPDLKLQGAEIPSLGQGSGMLGLPGDCTPPSRFVRAVAFTQSALQMQDAALTTNLAFHILNDFDIPKGFSRAVENGKTGYDYTQWVIVADLANKIYYLRSYENPKIFKVEFSKLNLSATEIKTLDTSDQTWFTEVS